MIRYLIILILTIESTKLVHAQTFYNVNNIQKIEIFFSYTNWDYMMDTAKAGSEGYILADSAKINGILYDSVGVKYKGNSSYSAARAKNPMHIELDYVKNQNYQGYTDVKLGNGYSDPSMIREVLSYQILSQYMFCPIANFSQLYINGNLIGLYSNVESVNSSYVVNNFYSSDNTVIKCNPKTVSGTAAASPSLTYLGSDSSLYQNYYEIKSTFGWNELVALCDTIKNNFSSIESIMDIDRAIWMLAFNNVLVNLDSYSGNFRQNYYEVKDGSNRLSSIIWDLNMSFAGFSMAGSGPPLTVSGAQNLTPTLHMGDNNWPLINKILADTRYKKMYIAHMRTINNENFSSGSYLTNANTLMAIIDTAFQSDPNKFFTYTQFQNSLTTTITSGPMTIPGIQQLMATRSTYLNATTEFTNIPPTITTVVAIPTAPTIGSTLNISATITNVNYAFLGYRNSFSDAFTKVQMFDDGLHGDGAASDSVFGVDLVLNGAIMQYYIYAENTNAGMFSPERAEHEFYTLYATTPTINPGDVVINELMSVNISTVTDAEGDYDDWIELYNNTSNILDLGNLFLSDNATNLFKFDIPINTLIIPNGYVIVWADNDLTSVGVHANFKLSSAGEKVLLTSLTGAIIDTVTFPALVDWWSYGRFPNGTGLYTNMFPTYNAQNSLVGIAEEFGKDVLKFYPNPTAGRIKILLSDRIIESVILTDLSGNSVLNKATLVSNKAEIDLSELSSGIYFIKVNGKFSGKVIKL